MRAVPFPVFIVDAGVYFAKHEPSDITGYTRCQKRGKNHFHKKYSKEQRETPHLLEKSRTGLLLDCTRFLSVVYCFCYGKVPVRCAGHSKEEKGNER